MPTTPRRFGQRHRRERRRPQRRRRRSGRRRASPSKAGRRSPRARVSARGSRIDGDLTIEEAGNYTVDISGTTPGRPLHDQLDRHRHRHPGKRHPRPHPARRRPTTTRAAGDQIVIIDNDGTDAVDGIFIGLLRGIDRLFADRQPDPLRRISSPTSSSPSATSAATGNDVVLTAIAQTATTNVRIDADGNLIIDDILGSDTDDNLSIDLVGGVFIIEEHNGNNLGTLIVGATQTSLNRIEVPEIYVTGGVIINTLDGDDIVTIGDLGRRDGVLTVLGGNGYDTITQNGDAELTAP